MIFALATFAVLCWTLVLVLLFAAGASLISCFLAAIMVVISAAVTVGIAEEEYLR